MKTMETMNSISGTISPPDLSPLYNKILFKSQVHVYWRKTSRHKKKWSASLRVLTKHSDYVRRLHRALKMMFALRHIPPVH